MGNEPVNLIGRMKTWIADNYPGTKTAITEYNLGAFTDISGALAQADLLGAFGREGLDLATLWGNLTDSQGVPNMMSYAFRLYRNYDGKGSAFGETSISAASDNQDQLSVYAAERSGDSALTLMVINKTANDLSSNVNIGNFQPDSAAQVWQYSAASPAAIVRGSDVSTTANGITATFPAYSATLLVVPEASALKAPKPVISAVVNAASGLTAIAPGTVVKITGTNLGPASGAAAPIPSPVRLCERESVERRRALQWNSRAGAVRFGGLGIGCRSLFRGAVSDVNGAGTVHGQRLGRVSDPGCRLRARRVHGRWHRPGTGSGLLLRRGTLDGRVQFFAQPGHGRRQSLLLHDGRGRAESACRGWPD